jgi:hypothetical protein
MRNRHRVILFVALTVVCALAGVAYVALGARAERETALPAPKAARPLTAQPLSAASRTILFRNLDRSRPAQNGFAAYSPLSAPARRKVVPMACGRVYFAGGRGLCLEPAGSLIKQRVYLLDSRLRTVGAVTVAGVPSRARVSPDGRYGSVTYFVYGHDYATPGAFSTATTLIDLRQKNKIANLERFTVTREGERISSPDFNFWGVTFADDSDRFYATLATRGRTYLVEGSVSKRTARVLHDNVECPSLSPDETRIAYKRRVGSGGNWRLTVLDLATMRETALAETKTVDDQAEWLDADRILYGRDGDLWVVAADGSGTPRRFLAGADSPAVIDS